VKFQSISTDFSDCDRDIFLSLPVEEVEQFDDIAMIQSSHEEEFTILQMLLLSGHLDGNNLDRK
jgi:hypothetical protein